MKLLLRKQTTRYYPCDACGNIMPEHYFCPECGVCIFCCDADITIAD